MLSRRLYPPFARLQKQLEMLLCDRAALQQAEVAVENRFAKPLSPWTGSPQQFGQFDTKVTGLQCAVGTDHSAQLLGIHSAAHFVIECQSEGVEIGELQRESCGHCVTAKLLQ